MSLIQTSPVTATTEKRVRDRRKDYKSAESWHRRSELGLVEERRRSIRRDEDREQQRHLSWYRDKSRGLEEPRRIVFDQTALFIRDEGKRRVIDFEGELSYIDHADVQTALRSLVAGDHKEVVLRMAKLTGLDSAGLGVLVGIHICQSRKGKAVTVVDVPPTVYRTIVNCGLQKMFAVNQ